MDWFKGKITGNPHISWKNQWFPVIFPIRWKKYIIYVYIWYVRVAQECSILVIERSDRGNSPSPLWEALNAAFLDQFFDVDYFSCVNVDAVACQYYDVQSHYVARFDSNGTYSYEEPCRLLARAQSFRSGTCQQLSCFVPRYDPEGKERIFGKLQYQRCTLVS